MGYGKLFCGLAVMYFHLITNAISDFNNYYQEPAIFVKTASPRMFHKGGPIDFEKIEMMKAKLRCFVLVKDNMKKVNGNHGKVLEGFKKCLVEVSKKYPNAIDDSFAIAPRSNILNIAKTEMEKTKLRCYALAREQVKKVNGNSEINILKELEKCLDEVSKKKIQYRKCEESCEIYLDSSFKPGLEFQERLPLYSECKARCEGNGPKPN